MRWSIWFVLPFVSVFAQAAGQAATALSISEPAFHDPQVTVALSMPPQFDVLLEREMPTPGWTFAVDTIDIDEKSGRITAKLTEVAPDGVVAQVLTQTTCRVPVGRLVPGVYLLELWLRRGSSTEHVLTQAMVLRAR